MFHDGTTLVRCILSEEENQEIVPLEQQTLLFYDQELIVVRLPDGRPGVVLGIICRNLSIDTTAQLKRIQRTEAIADDLVFTRIATSGGVQRMATLVLHAVPFWLAGIDPKRVREDIRPAILRYQREVVDVLYAWASTPRAISAPAKLVPSEPITHPARPAPDASIEEWIYYHQQMLTVLEWQRDIEHWRGSVESRLEGLEAITDLIPEILERLGPETLTIEHQRSIQGLVKRLNDATGKPFATIYDELKTAFEVPRYQEIPESEWDKVVNWFKVQIERNKRK